MTTITLRGISKTLGQVKAVRDVSLSVSPGELFFILGSSGSGKSTLLNLVAGLLTPSSGTILFDERDVTQLPTEARNAVLCFQSYALWPHLTVEQNVAFGLETRGLSAALRVQRVADALEQVRLKGFERRYPGELSGGQQQRVALARALVVRPACLLLDEPLSNLDTKLRSHVRNDIRRLCKEAGLTTLYVTHDQKEALSVADRIAVMHEGELLQVDTPAVLFNRPRTRFVADFISQSNLLSGRITQARDDGVEVETAVGPVLVSDPDATAVHTGDTVWLAIRPDQVQLTNARSSHTNTFVARCVESSFLGEWSEHHLSLAGQAVQLRLLLMPAKPHLPDEVHVCLPQNNIRLLPGDG